jgi:hypothetical protein
MPFLYQGAWALAWTSGLVTAPLIGVAAYRREPAALWIACAACAALAAVLLLDRRRGTA